MYRYFRRIVGVGSVNYIYYWKSEGLSVEIINSITASSYKITSQLSYYGTRTKVEFNGSCLKQDCVTFNHGKIVNIYIVHQINKSIHISDRCSQKYTNLTNHMTSISHLN